MMLLSPTGRSAAGRFLLTGLTLVLTACASAPPPPPDPATSLARLRDPDQMVPERVAAAEQAVEAAAEGVIRPLDVWETLKTLAWSGSTPAPLRRRSVELLVTVGADADPESIRAFTRLRLPTEPDRAIVAELARAAAQRGWTDATTALVRRLAVPDDAGNPNRRVEAAAILALHPGRSLEATVFEVFVHPEVPAVDDADRWRESVRGEVWELLGRLDRDASVRAALLSAEPAREYPDDVTRALACLRKGVRELGVVPDTAAELSWLTRLCGEGVSPDEARASDQWWQQARAAIASVPLQKRLGLALRHVEPVRWASRQRSDWLAASREDLLDELRSRLATRSFQFRTADMGSGDRSRSRERLDDWADDLRWADLLAVLVVDEALREGGVAHDLLRHADLDRGDTGTEYGGIVEAIDTVPPGSPGLAGRSVDTGGFRAVLYPPRTRDRIDDRRFIASFDMIRQSDRALAHYHMHAQTVNNSAFAGPSRGDLVTARTSGRTSLVFTSIGSGRLNADYYQPNGVVIDLGTIEHTPQRQGPAG